MNVMFYRYFTRLYKSITDILHYFSKKSRCLTKYKSLWKVFPISLFYDQPNMQKPLSQGISFLEKTFSKGKVLPVRHTLGYKCMPMDLVAHKQRHISLMGYIASKKVGQWEIYHKRKKQV